MKHIPGVFVPTRYVEEVGLSAGHCLAQIIFWLVKASDGKSHWIVQRLGRRWLAHSRVQLMQETGLSESLMKGALQKLRNACIIVAEQHLFEAKNVTHIRLHDDCPAWVGDGLPAGKTLSSLLEMAKNANSISQKTKGENKEDSDALGASVFSEEKKKGYGENNGSTLGNDPAGEHPGKLAKIYRDAYAEVYPDVVLPSFTRKEMGQLKQLVKFTPPGEAGAILNFAARNWPEVKSAAASYEGAFNVPAMPTLGFILSKCQSVVTAYHDSLKAVKPKASKWVPQVSGSKGQLAEPIVPELPDEDKPATLEEVAEILGLNG